MATRAHPLGNTEHVCWHGDSLTLASAWPTATLDFIYIDPPFGTGRAQRQGALAYDDATEDPKALTAWLLPWLMQSHRTLRATGSLVVHLDWRSAHYVKVALDDVFGRDKFINEIIWCYAVGGKSRRRFANKHDTLLWYGKCADYAFYPDAVSVPRRAGSHMKVVLGEDGREVQVKRDRKSGKEYRYPLDAGKIPEDWWADIETLNRSAHERVGWPTQKPLRLLERLIKATTQPGDWVADWFAGSGTTAAAAHQLGRHVATADASQAAMDIVMQRLRNAGATFRTDLPTLCR